MSLGLPHLDLILATRHIAGLSCVHMLLCKTAAHALTYEGASAALMLYEHALCIEQEISLVWLGKWSRLQALMLADIYVREVGMLFIALGKAISLYFRPTF